MPFTFAHPAIVLPLASISRKWFSITGLVIGSLTPDFEYFIRMSVKSIYSHSIEGLFWCDLPLGLLLAFLFHSIVRDNLIENLPQYLKARFVVFSQFNWKAHFKSNWFIVLVSILIGASSHIFWDSFTHKQGYFVSQIPLLSESIEIIGHKIQYLKIMQHASTLIGGLIIVFVIFNLPKTNAAIENSSPKYWITVILLTAVIFILRYLSGLGLNQYGNIIVSLISAGLLSLIITPLILNKRIDL